MSRSLLRRLALGTPLFLLYCCISPAQVDEPLVLGSQRTDEMKRMIREFIEEAQRMENEGDNAGAILMKNRAMGLLKSLRSMSAPQVRPRSREANASPAEKPTITRAEAVVTLQKSIIMLELLGEKELGRRVKRVMSGIASEQEIAEIMEYQNQRQKESQPPPETPAADESSGIDSLETLETPSPRTKEQIQNQVIALKASMDALLDFEQNEEARLLAQSIMLRRGALKSSKLTWEYPTDYQKTKEIEVLKIAGKRLFEAGNIAGSKMANDLANRLKQEQVNEIAIAGNKDPDQPSTTEQRNQSITRLTQEYQKSESARMRLQNENRQLERLNATLQNEIQKLKGILDKSK